MADHPNLKMLKDLWNGFFGDKQKPLWERGAEIMIPLFAPAIARAVLYTEFKRRDGEPITLAGQMGWWAKDIAVLRADNAGLRDALKQSAGGAPIDYEKVGQASAKAIAEYVDSVEKTTTTVNLKES